MMLKTSLRYLAIGVVVVVVVSLSAVFILRARWRADIAEGETPIPLEVKISSFANGGAIPRKYTCLGENLSPSIEISSAPAGAKSIAIVMDDPDSPFGFVHWLVYNIPGDVHAISEGASSLKKLPAGATEGLGSGGSNGYAGPCPPGSKPHRYVIRIYALATNAMLAPAMTKQQLAVAVHGLVLAEGQWSGVFGGDNT
jgi:Raf kinase inhibitor-like YbhB/YbcL family protein